MKDLEVPVLTTLIWLGAAGAVFLGTVSHLLNWIAKKFLLGIYKANRRLGNKEECFAFYGLTGLEIAKHASGIVLATLPEDDSPPLRPQYDEKPVSASGQSFTVLSDEEREVLQETFSADDSTVGRGQDGLAGEQGEVLTEEPVSGEKAFEGSVAHHPV